ncbi:uncharacterized protein LOC132563588 [Ylistrum balloti]|uniref:uncharacterized protein LOC132563588 n=1 Tax=Ylistrum balloti TaxID=509963 RepID=UPI00290585DA|nr:uncharacterized protein LOC132563588 [Ylistrum balloti]
MTVENWSDCDSDRGVKGDGEGAGVKGGGELSREGVVNGEGEVSREGVVKGEGEVSREGVVKEGIGELSRERWRGEICQGREFQGRSEEGEVSSEGIVKGEGERGVSREGVVKGMGEGVNGGGCQGRGERCQWRGLEGRGVNGGGCQGRGREGELSRERGMSR